MKKYINEKKVLQSVVQRDIKEYRTRKQERQEEELNVILEFLTHELISDMNLIKFFFNFFAFFVSILYFE